MGEFLRCSMGLSAWKQYGNSRWALRVNPSSGNLHPTETYIVRDGQVSHYAVKEHALEHRGTLPVPATAGSFLVALTSIHWREARKYGERAYRYCQHDAGHAIAALRLSAAMLGWRLRLLEDWSSDQVAALLGVDRDDDFADAEREEPECLAVVWTGVETGVWTGDAMATDPGLLVDAARRGVWQGRANRLSADRMDWPVIDEVAHATRTLGRTVAPPHHRSLAQCPFVDPPTPQRHRLRPEWRAAP